MRFLALAVGLLACGGAVDATAEGGADVPAPCEGEISGALVEPQTQGPCVIERCTGLGDDDVSTSNASAGTPCEGGTCDGAGVCVE